MKIIKGIFSILFLLILNFQLAGQEQVYELRTYELEFGRPEQVLHDYFKEAFIPAMNRQGVKNIGVFEEVGEALPKKLYVLIPYNDIAAFQKSGELLIEDEKYIEDASPYLKISENLIPYSRITTDLIQSTTGFPSLQKPADNANFFELRIYESYNEDALRRKVKMFNDSEFGIFEDVGLPTVFFGSNIGIQGQAGPHRSMGQVWSTSGMEANLQYGRICKCHEQHNPGIFKTSSIFSVVEYS